MNLRVECKNLGFDCPGIVQSKSEQELLKLVADHARQAHGIDTITDELLNKVKSVIETTED